MPDKVEVRALLERYASTMKAKDREGWLDCFADDAVQEDPVGSEPNVGREAIGRFYDTAITTPVTLTVTDDPLVIGNEVLAFFKVVVELDGKAMTIPRIVDHIVLSEDGTRFQSLRAFFDLAELAPLES
jgi:steroid delta-isomerase